MKKKALIVIVTTIVLLFILGIASTPKQNKSTVITPEDFVFQEESTTDTTMYLDVNSLDGTEKKLSIHGLPKAILYVVSGNYLFYLAEDVSSAYIPCYWGYNCTRPVVPLGLTEDGFLIAEDSSGEVVAISPTLDMASISEIHTLSLSEEESKIVYQVVLN